MGAPTVHTLDELKAALDAASELERRQYLHGQGWPRFLYKYRAVAPGDDPRLREIVVDSKLWLAPPASFNDPFDMTMEVVSEGTAAERERRIRELVEQRHPGPPSVRRKVIRRLLLKPDSEHIASYQSAQEQLLRESGVVSFASDPRSILMWTHYANQHDGICLQFYVASAASTFVHAQRVLYSSEYPTLNWMRDTQKQIAESLLRKFAQWEYEGERRVVMPNAANSHFPFPSESLTGVILGCRASPETEAVLRRLLDERRARSLPAIRLYRARRHRSKYELQISRT